MLTLIIILLVGLLLYFFRDEAGVVLGWLVEGFIAAVSHVSYWLGTILDAIVDWIVETAFYLFAAFLTISFLIVGGVLFKKPLLTGFAFIAAVVMFLVVWTLFATGRWLVLEAGSLLGGAMQSVAKRLGFEVGADEEGHPVIFYPCGIGYVVFWLCVVACVAVLHPEIAASGMFIVLSLLVVGVLWGFGHALNKKSDAPEWIMLVAVLLMVGIYAMKQTAPALYNVVDGQVVVLWNRAQDKVETPEPLKPVEELRKLKLQVVDLEEKDVLAELANLQTEQIVKWSDPNARAEIDEKIWEIENVEIPNLREQKKLLARAYEEPAGEKKWFYAILITLVILIAMFLVLILLRRVAHVESKWATGVVVVATICILGVIYHYSYGVGIPSVMAVFRKQVISESHTFYRATERWVTLENYGDSTLIYVEGGPIYIVWSEDHKEKIEVDDSPYDPRVESEGTILFEASSSEMTIVRIQKEVR